jgi:hypothetical protein
MGHADVFVATDLAGGALWGATYLLILRRGARDRTSGVPLLALASAFAWELLFGVVRPTAKLPPFVVPVWLSLDACILYQFLRYRTAASTRRARALRCAGVLAAVLGALGIEHALVVDLGDLDGVWSGFAVNAVMSAAFVARLARRREVGGQSMAIALAKLAGSAFTVPHALALHGSMASLRTFIAVTLAMDVAYVVQLHRTCRSRRSGARASSQ